MATAASPPEAFFEALGVPIHLVHGALDWMFPVKLAQMASDELSKAGAQAEFHELADLSHAYPREHNARILEWLDPALAPG
jgi:phospholipase/carboxylesterase